jgi:hypothetical protein
MRAQFQPKDLWTAVNRLGHRTTRGDDNKIECSRCGIDMHPIMHKVLKDGRLIAGVIPRCPGHRPLNYFVYRRPTMRELLERFTAVRKRDEI